MADPKTQEQLDRIEAGIAKTNRMLDRQRERMLAQTRRVLNRIDRHPNGMSADEVRALRADAGELEAALVDDEN